LLSLDRTPAAELIAGTAHAWLEAITADNTFQRERDTPRIRAAFRTMANRRESWPAPRHFLDALPKVEQSALCYEVKPATREEAARAITRIRELLNEPVPDFAVPGPVKREGPPLSEVEEGLEAHYRDRRSVAAGDPS
jgi:hypothetical protein